MTLANKRVRVARPTVENRVANGVVGVALPAIGVGTLELYFLIPYYGGDMDKGQRDVVQRGGTRTTAVALMPA